jgi:hypothetical protein
MQHRAAVTQSGDAPAVEQVGVNAGDLGRAVSSQTQHPTRELVDQFEGLKVKRLAGTGQQGLQMLQHGRHDQLIAVATRHVEQVTTEFFDMPGLGRQDIGNMIRQEPGRHVKNVKR